MPVTFPLDIEISRAARLLPIRQSLGQFLSRYPVDVLGGGLQAVALKHDAAHAAEARVLLGWLRERLAQCGGTGAAFSLAPLAAGESGTFALSFGNNCSIVFGEIISF